MGANPLAAVPRIVLASFIFFALLLPSGSIYSFNVKIALSSSLFLFVFALLLVRRVAISLWIWPLFFTIFCGFYFSVGLVNGVSKHHAMSQIIAFLSLFLAIYLPLAFIRARLVAPDEVLKWVFISFGTACVAKIVMQALLLFWIEFSELRALMVRVFGVSFIGLDAGWYYRIHFPSDYFAPVVLYALLIRDRLALEINGLAARSLFFLTLVSVLLAYSRFLWVFSFFAILLGIVFSLRKRIVFASFFGASALIVGFLASSGNRVLDFIRSRYLGDYARSSDEPRVEMLEALLKQVSTAPWFGRGMGAGVPGYTNIESIPWYFEIQWLGFAMQFGLVGFGILFGLALYLAFVLVLRGQGLVGFGLMLLYLVWILLGFFNGFMLTSMGGLIFLLYILFAVRAYAGGPRQIARSL